MTNVSAQFIHDTMPESIDHEIQLKMQGATEMVMYFIKKSPRSMGKTFLVDLLNSYKAMLRSSNNDK